MRFDRALNENNHNTDIINKRGQPRKVCLEKKKGKTIGVETNKIDQNNKK